MTDSVNHYRVKRQAHGISRRDSEQAWNPFRHLTWEGQRRVDRRGTWNGNDIEGQQHNGPIDEDNALDHAQTMPGPLVPRDFTTDPAFGLTNNADQPEEPATRTRSASQQESGETGIESQRSTFPLVTGKDTQNSNSPRNRKREDPQTTGDEKPVDMDGKKVDKKKTGFLKNVQPRTPFTVANQLQRTLLNSWINILLLAAPVGIALNYVSSINRIAVFIVNFIAIIPLAAMLSFGTEEIALRTGETLGGLLNATFGYVCPLFPIC